MKLCSIKSDNQRQKHIDLTAMDYWKYEVYVALNSIKTEDTGLVELSLLGFWKI